MPETPTRLIIVGAAAGIGRWFGDHILAAQEWDSVVLIDAAEGVRSMESPFHDAQRAQLTDAPTEVELRAALTEPATAVIIGVPLDTLSSVATWLLPLLHPTAVVFDLSHDRMRADEILRAVRSDLAVIGVHALFGITAPSADGQTFVVTASQRYEDAHRWITEAIHASGGTVNMVTSAEHDRIMRVVQTAAHHALLTFVDVVHHSGLDLERDLWANRTPTFEVLLALASRVLTPGQDSVTASIQLADESQIVAEGFDDAQRRLRAAREDGALAQYLAEMRSPFPSSLFTKAQQVGALATSAVQATRTEISRQRRADGLVGVRSLTGPEKLHVGRIENVTATSFVLREVLVGQPGRAALLTDDAAIVNAKRLGIGGKTKTVEFTLGRVRILSNDELEDALNDWLPQVTRGIKLLVPESISGLSVVHVVEGILGVAKAELISEEVRLGQREIVVRVHARNDRNLDELERSVSAHIDNVFVWPDGVVLPVQATRIGYLGPAGTFSQTAATQLGTLIRVDNLHDNLVEYPGFDAIVSAVSEGQVDVAVVPIANSSSGLVDLAAAALLGSHADLVAGGVVDVLVRFDAYVPRGTHFAPGLTVFTHPQVIRQCSQFIAANALVAVECSSTAEACRRVAEEGSGVAIANVGLGDDVGLDLARTSVGNLAGAVTRFLVVGRNGTFGASPRQDATIRSVWLAEAGVTIPVPEGARFDELLHGPSGRTLIVSTSTVRLADGPGIRSLGSFPWSPRTPVVVVG